VITCRYLELFLFAPKKSGTPHRAPRYCWAASFRPLLAGIFAVWKACPRLDYR